MNKRWCPRGGSTNVNWIMKLQDFYSWYSITSERKLFCNKKEGCLPDLCRKNLKNLIKILVGLFKMKFNCDSWRIPYELHCYLLKNSYDWDLVCWKLCRCYKSVRLDLITFQSLFTLINWIADYNDACTVCSVTQIKTSQSYSQ